MTHMDGKSGFSARSQYRRDAGHHKMLATLSESPDLPPLRSFLRPVGGRQQALPMRRIARGSLPTRLASETIPMGHYYLPLV